MFAATHAALVTIGEASLDFRPYQKVIFAVGLVAFLAGLCSFCYLADRKGYLDELNAYVGGIAVLTGVPAVCFAVIFHPAWLLVKLFGEMPVQKVLQWANRKNGPEGARAAAATETAGLLASST